MRQLVADPRLAVAAVEVAAQQAVTDLRAHLGRSDWLTRDIVGKRMSESMTIVVSILGTGIGIIGVLGLMLRMLATNMARQFDATGKRIDDLKTDMNRQFGETGRRFDRIETQLADTNKRIDDVGRDIADLRDRTGVLEGTLSTFMNERRNPNAA